MKIFINVKSGGSFIKKEYTVPDGELSLRELLTRLTRDSLLEYAKDGGEALSARDYENMKKVGRVRFERLADKKRTDEGKAVENVMQCFADGLFRVFVNERELTEPDAPAALNEGDTLTLVKLAPLSGGFFPYLL